ncbi:CGNR zinc finger domain-containing protein [Corynebacterium pacaense]|uniref:CGNR zinc finger domain-containing protein n=1 Tax=Corynebacterium pacaense TaxID=1816684 RepID=UPI0015C46591|nr:ABATE domain-containing protein [Corynebacterium pacaense]
MASDPHGPDRLAVFTDHVSENSGLAPVTVPPRVLDRLFVTDTLSLSFIATVAQWGGAEADRLYSPERLGEWLDMVGLPRIRRRVSAAELEKLAALRRAVYRTVMARLAGAGPTVEDVCYLNEHAGLPRLQVVLDHSSWTLTTHRGMTYAQLLSELSNSALDAVAGPWSHRLRRCRRSPCTHVFIDRTSSGQRRWCTSEGCGNTARARAHRARSR